MNVDIKKIKEMDNGGMLGYIRIPDYSKVKRFTRNGLINGWLEIPDSRNISDSQRKKWYALVRDFSNYTGYPPDYSHLLFKTMYSILNDKENISLSNIDMTTASEMIDMLLKWCFDNDIPLNEDTGYLFREDIQFFYYLAHKKECFICGGGEEDKSSRHTHHVDKIGMGHNRKKVVHLGRRIMILCGPHHDEYHMVGHTKFLNKYHIQMIELTEELIKSLKIKEG